jgi:hypothetical protein
MIAGIEAKIRTPGIEWTAILSIRTFGAFLEDKNSLHSRRLEAN